MSSDLTATARAPSISYRDVGFVTTKVGSDGSGVTGKGTASVDCSEGCASGSAAGLESVGLALDGAAGPSAIGVGCAVAYGDGR